MDASINSNSAGISPQRGPGALGVVAAVGAAARLAVESARLLVIGAVVAQVMASLGAPVLAGVAGVLVDRVVADDPGRRPAPIVGVLIGVFVAQRLAGLAMSSLVTLAQQHASAEAAARFVEKATTIDAGHHHDAAFHDRMRHAEEIADARFGSMLSRAVGLCGAAAGMCGLAGVVALVSPVAASLVVAAVVVSIAGEQRGFSIVKQARTALVPLRRQQAYFRSLVTHDDAALELAASDAGADIARRHRRLSGELLVREAPAHRRQFAVIAAAYGAAGLVLAAAFVVAVAGALSADGSAGQVATLIAALTAFLQTSANAANSASGLLGDLPYLRDYFAFLATPALLPAPAAPATLPTTPTEGVVFDNVTFTYPDAAEAALCGVSLEIRPGELVALVGDNGAGKSTLIKLLLRFYDPDEGRVLIDGVDIRLVDAAHLRQRVGVLFQDFARYQLPLRDTVTLGQPQDGSDGRVRAALAAAGLTDFAAGLSGGLGHQLGRLFPGGHDISGGQWQRLALARLFFRQTGVVVLDEPTSSLDPRSEEAIFRNLRANLGARVGIVISHRFSTVRAADRIAVLSRGAVIEAGTHHSLIHANGTYAELFDTQAAHYR